MMNFWLRLLVGLLLCSPDLAAAQFAPGTRIPTGKSILVDGRIAAGEWDDARRIPAPDSVRLYLKYAGGYLLLGVQFPPAQPGFVDLYLTTAQGVMNFHASARLGQRKQQGRNWSAWEWWNNADWTANSNRIVSFEPVRLQPETAREMQIHESWFAGRATRLCLTFSLEYAKNQYRTVSYPIAADESDSTNWLAIYW